MATADPRNVQYLNADGSDTISQFPSVQRNNATRLSEAITTGNDTVALNRAFRNASGLLQRLGRLRVLSLEFRTASSGNTAQTLILASALATADRPLKTIYGNLAGTNDLQEATSVRCRLGTDGTLVCPAPTVMQNDAYYGGQVIWIVA